MGRSFAEILEDEMELKKSEDQLTSSTTPTSKIWVEPSLTEWFQIRFSQKTTLSSRYQKHTPAQPSPPPAYDTHDTQPTLIQPVVHQPTRSPRAWTPAQEVALTQLVRLGARLEVDASDIEIKKEYRRLARLLHPDMNRTRDDLEQKRRTEMFHLLRESYEVLTESPLAAAA